MAVTHSTAVRNGIADYVVDAIDGGSGAGKLVIRTSGTIGSPGTAVATLTFSDPAFGNAGASVAGRADADTIASDTNAAGGTAATATLQTSADTICVHCSVTATGGGGDITLSSVTIGAGDTVSISSLTYAAPS
jgi:hypothetical protein